MGYYIRELKNKISHPNWKVQFITYKKSEATSTKTKRPRREWDVKKNRWESLGFIESMTIEQSQARAKQLNAKLESRRQEEKRHKIEEEQLLLKQKFTASIPEIYKDEFELKYLTGRFQDAGWKKRFLTGWRASQKMLIEVGHDPSEWFENKYLFYDYLYKKQFSFSYIKKILSITNIWGFFLSRRLGQRFSRIPTPRGTERARLIEAYYEKSGGRSNCSDPITPELLENAKMNFKPQQYNWLYISVWLGLRPMEIDQLKEDKYVRLQSDIHGNPILWVYQTKLTSVPPRNRWKLIPIIFKEQLEALTIIKNKDMTRPHVKRIRKIFGGHTTLYGGRKGFTDLMLGQQQDFIHISQWMGHSTIERTWRSYKSRKITHYREVG